MQGYSPQALVPEKGKHVLIKIKNPAKYHLDFDTFSAHYTGDAQFPWEGTWTGDNGEPGVFSNDEVECWTPMPKLALAF